MVGPASQPIKPNWFAGQPASQAQPASQPVKFSWLVGWLAGLSWPQFGNSSGCAWGRGVWGGGGGASKLVGWLAQPTSQSSAVCWLADWLAGWLVQPASQSCPIGSLVSQLAKPSQPTSQSSSVGWLAGLSWPQFGNSSGCARGRGGRLASWLAGWPSQPASRVQFVDWLTGWLVGWPSTPASQAQPANQPVKFSWLVGWP